MGRVRSFAILWVGLAILIVLGALSFLRVDFARRWLGHIRLGALLWLVAIFAVMAWRGLT
jgi:hypothetical protein